MAGLAAAKMDETMNDTYASLSALIDQHLSQITEDGVTVNRNNNFFIPKIGESSNRPKNSLEILMQNMSLKREEDAKAKVLKDLEEDELAKAEALEKIEKEKDVDDDYIIDFTNAIIKHRDENEEIIKVPVEQASIKLCSTPILTLEQQPVVATKKEVQYCLDMGRVWCERKTIHKESSGMGKVFARKFKRPMTPYVRHDPYFSNPANLVVFRFNSPSPDDVVKANMPQWQKRYL